MGSATCGTSSAHLEDHHPGIQQHGGDSEPDHEVGDLQDVLRGSWRSPGLKPGRRSGTPEQKATLEASREFAQVAEGWDEDLPAGEPADTCRGGALAVRYGANPAAVGPAPGLYFSWVSVHSAWAMSFLAPR